MSKLVRFVAIGVVSVGMLFVNADSAKAQCCDGSAAGVFTNATYEPIVTYSPAVVYETETVYEAPVVYTTPVYSTPVYYTYRYSPYTYRSAGVRQSTRIARRNATYCCG